MPTHYHEVECNFKKTNKNEKPINPELVDYKFSNYELLKGILMRINNRYTPEEHAYLTEKLGHSPTLLNQHGKNNKVATSRIIKRYMKEYRADPTNTPLELEIDQYDELTRLCEEIESKPPSDVNSKEVNAQQILPLVEPVPSDDGIIYVQLRDELLLPMLTGGCHHKGIIQPIPCLLDTGSTISLASWQYIQSLGYSTEDLDNNKKYAIKTASGIQPAMGTVTVKLFLKSPTKQFYKFFVEVLVADCNLGKLILGYNFLKTCRFQWKADREPETVVLTCHSRGDVEVRRTFELRDSNEPVVFTNQERLNVYSMENRKVTLQADGYHPMSNAHMDVVTPQVFLPTHRESLVDSNEVTYKIEDETAESGERWPTRAYTCLTTTLLFKVKQSYSAETFKVQTWTVDQSLLSELEELNFVDIQQDSMDPMDQIVYDQISMTPSYLGDNQMYTEVSSPPKEDAYYVPKVGHLDKEWQDKFTQLFATYKGSMSKGKTDVGEAKVPPVRFPIPKEPHHDPVRFHNDTEFEVINDAVHQLLAADTVEETDGSSGWNSNIFLVSASNEQQKKLSGTIADKVTRQEQLEALRKSSRVVIDFRGVNKRVVNPFPGKVTLPKLDQLIPMFHDKYVSKADIRAGYHNIVLHPSVRPVTAFKLQNGKTYQYKKLPMGFHASPQYFINVLNVVLNKASFEKFKAKHPELKGTEFETSFLRYMDDICIVSRQDMYVHYLLWQYLLEQFSAFNLRLNVSKCQLLENDKIEYLGILINSRDNVYSLVPDRAQAFLDHQFALTRASLISRIMLYNYFRNLILFMKNITTCMMLLCREEGPYAPQKLHVREFEMLKLLIKMKIRLNIPNMLLPLCLSSDSSHTTYCSVLTQWVKPSQTAEAFRNAREGVTDGVHSPSQYACTHKGPRCDTFPCQRFAIDRSKTIRDIYPEGASQMFPFSEDNISREVVKQSAPPPYTEDEEGRQLVTCGIFSKSFHKDHLLASMAYKEAHGIIAGIQHFEVWLRGSMVQNFMFSDVNWVNYITRLKSTSTKLYSMSVYLSSFPNLYFIWTSSRVLNHACDLMSKMDTGFFLDSDFGIPKEILEPTRTLTNEAITAITPQTLHKVIMSPAPKEFTDTPYRRQVQYKELPTLKELDKILENPTPEEQVFNLMWYGSKYITPSHYLFTQKKNPNKVLSKTELQKLENKLKLDDIRTVLSRVEAHSHHVQHFSEMETEVKRFVAQIHEYLNTSNGKQSEPTLYRLADRYVKSITNTKADFVQLLDYVHSSSLVSTDSKYKAEFQEFVLINQQGNSEVVLGEKEERVDIKTNKVVTIPPKEICVLNLGINVSSRHLVDLNFELSPSVLYHLATRNMGPNTTFTKLYMTNDSNEPYVIQPHRSLGSFQITLDRQCCKNITKVIYVINKQDDTQNSEPTFLMTSVFNTILQPIDRQRPEHVGIPKLLTEVHNTTVEEVEEGREKQLVNRFLLLSHLLHNSNVISSEFVSELQNTDPDILKIRKLVDNNKAHRFKYQGKLLVREHEGGWIQLLLDRVTMKAMVDSMHANSYHLPEATILNHLKQHFFHPGMKDLVHQSTLECTVCQFTFRPRKRKFINIPPEDGNVLVNQVWSIDLAENLPFSQGKYKFLLIVTDFVSTYTMGFPLRTKKSEEIIQAMRRAFAAMNIPQVIRNDFSTSFASDEFREFLREHNITQDHGCPQRSESNGKVEVILKNYRDLLTSIVLHGGIQARLRWDESVDICNLLWNNTCPFSSVNSLSRYNLFYSSWRYQPAHLTSAWPEAEPENLSAAQEVALKKIQSIRDRQRDRYKAWQNPFEPGNLVSVIKSKEDQMSRNGGTALQPTSSSIYRIESVDPAGCRIISLKNSDAQTVEMSKLRLVSPRELLPNMGRVPMTRNNFEKSIFRKGSGRTLLETLLERSERAEQTPEEYVEAHDDIVEEEILQEPEVLVVGDESDNPRYNLRSRKIYHITLTEVNSQSRLKKEACTHESTESTQQRELTKGRNKSRELTFNPNVKCTQYLRDSDLMQLFKTNATRTTVEKSILHHTSELRALEAVKPERIVSLFLNTVRDRDMSKAEQLLKQLHHIGSVLRTQEDLEQVHGPDQCQLLKFPVIQSQENYACCSSNRIT